MFVYINGMISLKISYYCVYLMVFDEENKKNSSQLIITGIEKSK